ncbi:MAG TPA: L,D-transpeptidase family protein [Pirellulales bacterium]|nr:L,D-transpeptidase family protein [Pirellulales bacterium]
MNTIKTVFLAALLSAAAYGVYVGVTGSPPNFGHRRKSRDWEETAADRVADDDQSGLSSAPLVSVDTGPPPIGGGPASVPPASFTDPNPGMTGAGVNQSGSPLAGETGLDQYSSTQRYPSGGAPDAATPGVRPAGGDTLPPAESQPSGAPPGGEMAAGYEEPHAQGQNGHADFAALMQSVQSLLVRDQIAEAHLELSGWFGSPDFSAEENAQLTDLLDRLAGTVIYSRQHLLERPYEVQPGDTLDRIADAYEVPWELLANINGIRDPRAVRPGDTLKVVKGPFDAYINLAKFQLYLFLGNRYAGRFHIGIGKDQETPEGKFVVLRKITNPTYYGRGQPVIDKDDPNNPMGEYAIDLGNSIWIHGTNDPQSIGRADSRGCIRLADRDIKDIFEILTVKSDRSSGSYVQIKRY